nr:fatty acyl-CoA reductase 2-like [Tanacetum cinerariifolium]
MMGTMSLGSSSIVQKGIVTLEVNNNDMSKPWLFKKKIKCLMCCQSDQGNVIRSSTPNGVVSKQTKRLAVVNADTGMAVLDTQSYTPASKELVSYNGAQNASLIGVNGDGIGIVNVLKGKGFFVTGATGFLGKVFIEKILRTVPDVGKIYLLIKAKNKDAAMERLKNEIINTELFKSLQQAYGKSYQSFMLSKLVPVTGNVCESNLGLDEDMADVISKDVDIIVNSAANTSFDERYDIALDINTGGPSRLMSFAKKCKKLNLFLQVSTAYVNGQRQGRIMEKPFNIGDSIARERLMYGNHMPKLNVEDEIKMVLDSKKSLGENEMVQKLKELGLERAKLYGWQDTYVFTKAMGEMMIDKMGGDIPVVIIRPSVIESTYKEPFPGWMEGNRMMDPIVLYYGKGQLSGFLVDPNGVLDVVPADMVVNATLAAMAKHLTGGKTEDNHIYQIASSYLANIYEPYTFYGGRFDNSNTQKLMGLMSEEEKRTFGFDVGKIDWRDYISNVHIPGLRRHVMKGRGMCTKSAI